MKRQRLRKALILISFLFFPVTLYYFSPVLIIQGAAEGIVVGSFLVFAGMLVVALFLRRAFCGWACPAGGLQEACFIARDKRVRGGRYDWIKWFIWVPWIGIIVAFAVLAGGFHTVEPLFQTRYGISISEPTAYIIFYMVVGVITALSLVVGRRAFCHYGCWMAP